MAFYNDEVGLTVCCVCRFSELSGELRHDNTGCSSLLVLFLCVGVVFPFNLGSTPCILFALGCVINRAFWSFI
jgi:hypothetical protein